MIENTNYDLEQLNMMIDLIEKYLQKKINLEYLVNNLEAILYTLKYVSQDFKNKVISLWGGLEEIYAWMLDQKRSYLTPQEDTRIKEILVELQTLIEEHKIQA